MGLHVCAIGADHDDERGEWVEVANDGPSAAQLTGLEITDYTATQQHSHRFVFPGLMSGAASTGLLHG